MAVWEYRCTIVPAESTDLLTSLQSIADIDSLGLWSGMKVSDVLAPFPPELERHKGWTENLTIIKFGPTCNVEVYVKDGQVIDVQVLIDLRDKFLTSLERLVTICQKNDWTFVDDSLNVIPSSTYPLIESIQRSPAARFVKDPIGFLTGKDGNASTDGQ